MEHLKLFAARLNIPRLIRACEEQQHWRELVFLYVAYDEYDNAALVMMAHRCAAGTPLRCQQPSQNRPPACPTVQLLSRFTCLHGF